MLLFIEAQTKLFRARTNTVLIGLKPRNLLLARVNVSFLIWNKILATTTTTTRFVIRQTPSIVWFRLDQSESKTTRNLWRVHYKICTGRYVPKRIKFTYHVARVHPFSRERSIDWIFRCQSCLRLCRTIMLMISCNAIDHGGSGSRHAKRGDVNGARGPVWAVGHSTRSGAHLSGPSLIKMEKNLSWAPCNWLNSSAIPEVPSFLARSNLQTICSQTRPLMIQRCFLASVFQRLQRNRAAASCSAGRHYPDRRWRKSDISSATPSVQRTRWALLWAPAR